MNTPDSKLRTILWLWRNRAAASANAHYFASDFHSKRNSRYTIINVCSGILMLFFSNNNLAIDYLSKFFHEIANFFIYLIGYSTTGSTLNNEYYFLLSLISAVVVLTSTLQFVFNDNEIAIKHKMSGSEYSNIKRKIERILTQDNLSLDSIHRISNSLNWLGKSSPHIKRKIFSDSKEKFETDNFGQVKALEGRLLSELGIVVPNE